MEETKPASVWWTVLKRILSISALILICTLALYGLFVQLNPSVDGEGFISLFILLGLPYLIGLFAAYLVNPKGENTASNAYSIVLLILVIVLGAGAAILGEGVVCLLLASVLWLPMALLGALTTKRIQRRHIEAGKKAKLEMSLIATVPALLLAMDATQPHQITPYSVERSIVLDAGAEEIWPLLISLPDIAADEGRFTFVQTIARIPRPSSAVVAGEGVGAIRHAQWGENITFEEHITHWQEFQALSWNFVFPNGSISRYTDRHISPDGHHLRIAEGGYRLEPAEAGQTRLVLYTDYEAQTPLNTYAALWGEVFLGGIQANILDIIEGRLSH
ncbi:hypothetical protein [Ponticaulis sp.]|uniref:hypothetical protein n=1 Tax=Ponticaulis sp. TaxID=2020902 RepID=UPI000B62FF26|nr:hypothetical protein [Ponticaulis sp.]MAI90122.1 hypothetical protein [Ponticaulis sp.]OUX99777.1 MAG: hypothetical protein CBB65_06755 [Hyphomonadaceae bacterium TMED5]|tara:strand:- start:80709 stop:81707 length:999 start_codon:yes stop_codon:yes gene_type:complete